MNIDLFEYLTTHVVFPNKLPKKSPQDLVRLESEFLKLTYLIIDDFNKTLLDNKISSIVSLFKTWLNLQGKLTEIDSSRLHKKIINLEENESLALYLPCQNVCLLAKMYAKEVIMSYFQTSVDNSQLMSSTSDITACLPLNSIHIHCFDTFKSKQLSFLVADLANKQTEETLSKSKKAQSDPIELREVAKTDLVSNWLFSLLVSNSPARNALNFPAKVVKKFRDEIIITKGNYLPFRRSGMWMSIKGVLEIELCNMLPNNNEGLLVYKCLMTLVLERLCDLSLEFETNKLDDLRLQMIKKLARRVYKLNKLASLSNNLVKSIAAKCSKTINRINNLISSNHKKLLGSYDLTINLDYKRISLNDIVHVGLDRVIEKLTKLSSKNPDKIKKNLLTVERNLINIEFPNESYLNCPDDTLGIHLYDIEIWLLNNELKEEHYNKLVRFYFSYISKASVYYENDQVGYSRMMITCLKLIYFLDKIACKNFNLLKKHYIGIDLKLVEYLLVVKSQELSILYKEIINYISERNSSANFKSVVELDLSENAFAVRYAQTCEKINEIRDSIIKEAEQLQKAKIQEVIQTKRVYENLLQQREELECSCDETFIPNQCQKCEINKKIKSMHIKVFEWPLPLDPNQASAVLFELRAPREITFLRDALFVFKRLLIRNVELLESTCHEIWIKYDPLRKYSLNNQRFFSLGSNAKSFLKTHYTGVHVSSQIEEFIKNNGLSVNLISLEESKLIKIDDNYYENVQDKTTFKASEPFKRFQYAINSTSHSENRILAELNDLPNNVSYKELVKFGFMRSGHRLQMRNLLDCLETRILSLNNDSVTALISQLLWQIGPLNVNSALPPSHLDLENNDFIHILNKIINEYIEQIKHKWNDCFVLYNLINISLRCYSLNKSFKLINLLLKCRNTAGEWTKSLNDLIFRLENDQEKCKYTRQVFLISCFRILTYDVDRDQIENVLFDSTGVEHWLDAMKIIHNYKLKNKIDQDEFIVNLLRRVTICSLNISEQYNKLIAQSDECLTNVARSSIEIDIDSKWEPFKPFSYPYWYNFTSSNNELISISVTGEILRNYFPIRLLPESIAENSVFKSFFGSTNFDSSCDLKGWFCSTFVINDSEKISYKFRENNGNIIISEVFTNIDKRVKSFFIEPDQLDGYLPKSLVENFSHWFNEREKKIEFRPKSYSNAYLRSLSTSSYEYVLSLKTLILVDKFHRELISVKSETFSEITTKFTHRLDSRDYVHIFKSHGRLLVSLPRLELNFSIDLADRCIWSDEFLNFKVAECQRIDTLIGLKSYVLLRENENYPVRKLIVPHGSIEADTDSSLRKIIQIEHDPNLKEAYFVYLVDSDLKRLRGDDSNTAWLYLALLHAYTSQLLPDEFLNMTGAEMALYLLQSAICWSIKPLTSESVKILNKLSQLSPMRNYYPQNLKVMENVSWPKDVPAYCSHEGFQFIAEKLFNDSLSLRFVFNAEVSQDWLNKTTDETLAKRAYFRASKLYRPSQMITFLDWKKEKLKDLVENKDEINASIIFNIRLLQTEADSPHSKVNFLKEYNNCLKWKEASEMKRIDMNVSSWLEKTNFSSDYESYFMDHWLEIYKLALRRNKSKDDEIKLKFILGYFAYKAIDLESLMLFKRMPCSEETDFSVFEENYKLLDGLNFDINKINSILESNYVTLQRYNELRSLLKETRIMRRRNFAQFKFQDITRVKDHLKNYSEDLNYVCKEEFYERTIDDYSIKFRPNINDLVQPLFLSWKQNRRLNCFLNQIQRNISILIVEQVQIQLNEFEYKSVIFPKSSFDLVFDIKLNDDDKYIYIRAKFLFETGRDDSQINAQMQVKQIKKKEFPLKLDSNELNNLSQSYFEDLKKSWNYFSNLKRKMPLLKPELENEIKKTIKYYTCELIYYETQLKKFYQATCLVSECLILSGLWPCFSPILYLRNLLQNHGCENKKIFNNMIGGLSVVMILKERAIRCIKYYFKRKTHAHLLEKELSNVPFSNWSPAERPEWLILQLELNILIRDIQVTVAKEMLNPKDKNNVIQLNMGNLKKRVKCFNKLKIIFTKGEGKTAVIVPLLICSLTKLDYFVRLIVLKPLVEINYTALVYKIGYILNKRVYQMPFNRETSTAMETLQIYENLLNECYKNQHVLITLPEHCLSFKLKTIEMVSTDIYPKENAAKIREIQEWIDRKSRDILDESDEILATKYQLIYSMGNQSNLDGEKLRWIVARDVLKLAKNNVVKFLEKNKNQFEYIPDVSKPQKFPTIRLFDSSLYSKLKELICKDFLERKNIETKFHELNSHEKETLAKFILNDDFNKTDQVIDWLFHNNKTLENIMLILRGLLTYDILLHALKKRWKVEYGVNTENNNLLQAVPFRAKDVPAERAQFGHSDVMIILTYLNYYYNGLEYSYLDNLFQMLENDPHGGDIYRNWINTLPSCLKIDPSIKEYANINLKDSKQKYDLIYPILKWHTSVINYWLDNVLFSKEAKVFNKKLSASAWDLVSFRENSTTGFSGTNDSRYLLPLNIQFQNLPELIGTTASVMSSIISLDSNCFTSLDLNSTETNLLEILNENKIKVLIDVGALMIKYTNEQVVDEWLKIDKNAEAAVYFDSNTLMVKIKSSNKKQSFETSSFKQNLSKCLIYLDEFHTRGTDLNIPKTHLAGVTLGKGLTKDRLFQACMRMRLLGNGHECKFIASFEVNKLISEIENLSVKPQLKVLKWTIKNSINQISNEILYWANQGISFYKRETNNNYIEEYYTDLTSLYSGDRKEVFIHEIIKQKIKNLKIDELEQVVKKVEILGAHVKKHDLLLEEEMEKELEIELENEVEMEYETEKPECSYYSNELDTDVENFVRIGYFNKESRSFRSLMASLKESKTFKLAENESWSSDIICTADFSRSVKAVLFDDCFLRPPRWIAYNRLVNKFLILSAYEANELFESFGNEVVLLMIMPRNRTNQLRVISFPKIDLNHDMKYCLEQIFIYSGSLYFDNLEEQDLFLTFIGYCLDSSEHRRDCFDNGLIKKNGFVEFPFRISVFVGSSKLSAFKKDPSEFIIKLIDLRNYSRVPDSAHHFEIFLNGRKPLEN